MDITTSNHYIEHELHQRLLQLESAMKSDVIALVAPMYAGIDDIVRTFVEEIGADGSERNKDLSIVLETDGGSIEVVERIADVLRHHYTEGEINFIVPNRAMSAGTVLVMCGDNIYMDYYSVLGPVDPQVRSQTSGFFVPALGYLNKYEELVEKSHEGTLSAAEMGFMIEKFDPAELDSFEKARDLSTALLVHWLTKYKFKDWNTTKDRGLEVTDDMKAERAEEIGKKLNDTDHWKSHSRGISMSVLQRDLNLVVEDFGTDDNKNDAISQYHRLLQDYMQRRGKDIVFQNRHTITLL